MKKISFNLSRFFGLLALFSLLVLANSLVIAAWDCDKITIDYTTKDERPRSCIVCHTVTINLQNTPNFVFEGIMLIEYNTDELTYGGYDITGCLVEEYYQNPWINIIENYGGPGGLYIDVYGEGDSIPAGKSGCWINLHFENHIFPEEPEVCITDLYMGFEEWCDIFPICCQVHIDPVTADVISGETVEFSATSPYCAVNEGTYTWSIDPTSEHGSSIDSDGLYTAGCLINSPPIEEYINATDAANGDIIGTAVVNLEGCRISSIGGSSLFESGESETLSLTSSNCPNPSYQWSIDPTSTIGSTIDHNGLYKAGINLTGENVVETIKVKDMNNCCGEECANSEKQVEVKPCIMNLAPQNPTRGAGGTIQFSIPQNTCCPETPTYTWSVESAIGSTISPGNTVNAKGYYRAGRDFPDCNDVEDTIKLLAYCSDPSGTKEVETKVTIPSCKVTIKPESASVYTWESLQFSATVNGCCDNQPLYTWSLSSMGTTSGGTINSDGLYTAGPNGGTDIITVTDTANDNAAHTAMVTVEAPTTTPTTTTSIPPGGGEPGTECTSDDDCDDGLFCNGAEICSEGYCWAGSEPCPDDEVFCNGEESCDEEDDVCTHSGDPCAPDLTCDEDNDLCIGCSTDAECNDGVFCNGVETCQDGVCQLGSDPCLDDGLFCNGEESCDEENNVCTQTGDPCSPGEECDEGDDVCEPVVPLPSILVNPDPVFQSRWIPLPVFLGIEGDGTHFNASSSVTFNPASAVLALPPWVLDEENIFILGLLMPLWLTGPLDVPVDVTVITGSQEAPGVFEVELLPLF